MHDYADRDWYQGWGTIGGSGDDLGGEVNTLMPDNERDSLFVYYDHELTDNLTVYGQVIRGSNATNRYNDPRGSLQGTPTAATSFQDNAFLPDSVRQTMIDEGLEAFTLRRMSGKEDSCSTCSDAATSRACGSASRSKEGRTAISITRGGSLPGWWTKLRFDPL